MGEEFTFQNVRIVIQAIANYLRENFSNEKISVILIYDTRFLSERFAFEAAKIFSHNQMHVYLSERDSPSQALAYQVIKRKAQAGVNFTASFNPPEYNGLKFNTETGAPALPEVTDKIEKNIRLLFNKYSFCPYYPKGDFIERIDVQRDYLNYIQDKIDFDSIRKAKIRIGVDLLYGTSREYLDEILEENKIDINEIHGYIDPYFGGITPSCTEENLGELKKLVRENNCHFGIATDADGDRFGIVDERGRFVPPNIVLSLLLDYLVTIKGWKGGVARSVATTHMLDRIARKYDLPLYQTPVGFKYIADLFLEKKIIFGGEESACLAVKDHLPEKDGIIAGLLVAEMMAAKKECLSEQIKSLYKKYGKRITSELNIPVTPERQQKLKALTKSPPDKIKDRDVLKVDSIEGLKLELDNDDWILLRPSGTIPAIRCYVEAESKKTLAELMNQGMRMIS